MGKNYIKCDCCGRKIPFGEIVYFHHGYCGTYCSAECYADSWGESDYLDEELVEDNGCEVFNDEQRKKDLLKEMEELSEKLAKAKFELESLH